MAMTRTEPSRGAWVRYLVGGTALAFVLFFALAYTVGEFGLTGEQGLAGLLAIGVIVHLYGRHLGVASFW